MNPIDRTEIGYMMRLARRKGVWNQLPNLSRDILRIAYKSFCIIRRKAAIQVIQRIFREIRKLIREISRKAREKAARKTRVFLCKILESWGYPRKALWHLRRSKAFLEYLMWCEL